MTLARTGQLLAFIIEWRIRPVQLDCQVFDQLGWALATDRFIQTDYLVTRKLVETNRVHAVPK